MIRPEDPDIPARAPYRGLLSAPAFTFAAALLAACAQSPADKTREAEMELRSWEASLHLLHDAEAGGAIPRRFAAEARRTLERERERAEAKREQVSR